MPEIIEMIEFTPEKLKRFKKEYNKAVGAGDGVFTFSGHEFVVGYAKYMIEYLDSQYAQEHGG